MNWNQLYQPLRALSLAALALAALPSHAQSAQTTTPDSAQTAPDSSTQNTAAPANAMPGSTAPASAAAESTVVATVGEHRVVSLREALTLTAQQGPDVAAARAQAAIAEAGVRRAWTAWQPDVTAGGTFDHTSAPQTFDLSAIGLGMLTVVAQNSLIGQVAITQPLLTPQGLFGPSIANHAAESALRGSDEAREQILLSAAQAYFALQGIEGLLQAAHDLETVALHREDEAKAQIKAGTAVELQLLRAQSDTAEARLQIANLEGQRESLLPVLEALAGAAIQPMPAGSNNHLPNPSRIDSDPWENAFAVRSAIEGVKAAQASVRLDDWLWLPSIAAAAKGSYNSNNLFTAGKNYYYDLILQATIPLYDHGARYASLHEDQAKLQQAMAHLASARAMGRATWIGARANLAASQAALAQAEAQASVATRAQTQVEASFKAGVATSLDLTDADNKRFTATSAAAQARTVVDLRQAQLAAAEGHLYTSMVGSGDDGKQ